MVWENSDQSWAREMTDMDWTELREIFHATCPHHWIEVLRRSTKTGSTPMMGVI